MAFVEQDHPRETAGTGRFAAKPRAAMAGILQQAGPEPTLEEQAQSTGDALDAVATESRKKAEQYLQAALPGAKTYTIVTSDAEGDAYQHVTLEGVYGKESVMDEDGILGLPNMLDALPTRERQLICEEYAGAAGLWAASGDAEDCNGYPLRFGDFDDGWRRPPSHELASRGFEPGRIDYAAHRATALASMVEDELSADARARGVSLGRVVVAPADPALQRERWRNELNGRLEIDLIEDDQGNTLWDVNHPRDEEHADLAESLAGEVSRINDMLGGGNSYHRAASISRTAQVNGTEGFTATETPLDLADLRFRRQRGYDEHTLFGTCREPLAIG